MVAGVGTDAQAGVGHPLPQVGGGGGQAGDAVDDVDDQVVAVDVVEHRHVEGRGRGALLLVPAYMQVVVAVAAVGEAVDEPGVAVEVEDDRLVGGEEGVELGVRHAVRVFGGGLQAHQVDDVDDADLQVGQVLAQQRGGGERFQ